MQVGEYVPKLDRDGTRLAKCNNNLYVKNFSPESGEEGSTFSDEQLRGLFEEFGEVSSAVVMRDAEGKSRGFGFVCFPDWRDA